MKKKLVSTIQLSSALLTAGLILHGCGSSGSSNTNAFNNGTSNSSASNKSPSNDWVKGRYKGLDEFYGYCYRPDYIREQKKGSLLHEQHFVRELMNDIYLWREDTVDLNPNTFDNPITAFYGLKSKAITASGKSKDEFSGMMWYDDYIQRYVDGVEFSIGAHISASNLDEADDGKALSLTIAYVEEGSPAALDGLKRGDKIIEINGQKISEAISFSAKVDLYYSIANPTSTSGIRLNVLALGTTESNEFYLRPTDVTINPVIHSQIISENSNTFGYLVLNTFSSDLVTPQLQETFADFSSAGVNELILDLRYNGGGSIYSAQRLAYMIAGEANTKDKTFSTAQWNSRHPNFDPITGELLADEIFIPTEEDNSTPLNSLNLNRVTVLTTGATCSASELVMNALKGIDIEVVQIGNTTCGKPYGFYGIPNCELVYFPVQFQTINAKGFGSYADGFSAANGGEISNTTLPGCSANDDLDHALGNTDEKLLASAIFYSANGHCPEPEISASKPNQKVPVESLKYKLYRQPWENIALKGLKHD